ncbi:MAG: flippase-like domain-containing protein [Candidatus Diapherotrites archaeon]|nr:flippase-like domain-containing protein [Candidatus Diapherotrites archaeon]
MLDGLALLADARAAAYIILAVIIYFVNSMIYALREYLAIRGFGKNARYWEIFKAYLASLFVNNITPVARTGGEALRIIWINKRENVPKSTVTAAIIYERATEGPIIGILAILAAASFHFNTITAGIVALAVIGGIALMARSDLLLTMVEKLSGEMLDAKSRKMLERNLKFGKTAAIVTALSATVWTMEVLRIWVELHAVRAAVPISVALTVAVANVVLGIMGITPGGVGIVEGGLIGVLMGLGFGIGDAAKFVAIERGISFVLSSIVGFLVMSAYGGKEAWRLLKSRWRRTGSSQG